MVVLAPRIAAHTPSLSFLLPPPTLPSLTPCSLRSLFPPPLLSSPSPRPSPFRAQQHDARREDPQLAFRIANSGLRFGIGDWGSEFGISGSEFTFCSGGKPVWPGQYTRDVTTTACTPGRIVLRSLRRSWCRHVRRQYRTCHTARVSTGHILRSRQYWTWHRQIAELTRRSSRPRNAISPLYPALTQSSYCGRRAAVPHVSTGLGVVPYLDISTGHGVAGP